MAKAPFWSTQNTDPKRKFRWVVRFSQNDDILSVSAKNIKKPSYEVTSTAHKWINHTFFFPGRLEWKEITLTLVDIGGPKDVTTILAGLTHDSGYRIPRTPEACKFAITKQKSVKAFGNLFEIIQLGGPDGNQPVEKWILTNPWVKTVDFGELSYENDELVELNLTIQYDYAEKDKDASANLAAGITDTVTSQGVPT